MGFCLQLRLLLWKNCVIRKRQLLRCIAELIWPLLMFTVLVIVRTTIVDEKLTECNFPTKAMPSTGFTPFLRSYFCSLNNQCQANKMDAKYTSEMIFDSGSIKSRASDDGSTFAGIERYLNSQGFNKDFQGIQGINTLIKRLNNRKDDRTGLVDIKDLVNNPQLTKQNKEVNEMSERIYNSKINPANITLNNVLLWRQDPQGVLCDGKSLSTLLVNSSSTELDSILTSYCNMSRDEMQELISQFGKNVSQSDNHTIQDWRSSFSLNESNPEFMDIMQLMTDFGGNTSRQQVRISQGTGIPPSLMMLGLLDFHACGKNNSFFEQVKNFAANSFTTSDLINANIKSQKVKYSTYKEDPDATAECNALFQSLEANTSTRFIWNHIKPMFRGRILYAPNTSPIVRALMEDLDKSFEKMNSLIALLTALQVDTVPLGGIPLNVIQFFKCFQTNKIDGFPTELEAEVKGLELLPSKKLWAVVVFPDVGDGDAKLPTFVRYKIRMDSYSVDESTKKLDRLWNPGARSRPRVDLKVIESGFAYLQDLIEHNIIKMQTGSDTTPGIFLQQFPYPCHISSSFAIAISRLFPFIMVMSWIFSVAMISKSIVHEKETRLKETMRVMGVGNAVHWIAWFIDSVIPMFISTVLLTILLTRGNVLTNSDPIIVFIFLFEFCLTTIALVFLISTFFSQANLAAAVIGILYYAMYMPFPMIMSWDTFGTTPVPANVKITFSLFSNVAFAFGCVYLADYETQGKGIQWDNMAISAQLNDTYSFLGVLLMMLLDALIYMLLALYVEAAFPGQYGVAKPFYFPLTPSFWRSVFGLKPHRHPQRIPIAVESDKGGNSVNEKEPSDKAIGVSVQNLTKVYDNGKIAVSNLSVNFYEDQITSFLGHNGAGKTTTISILTGLYAPTSGTATINGLDITKDMDSIRNSLGICPQHNVLFDNLTVDEHLWFFARLKGRKNEEITGEINEMLIDLGITAKKSTQAKNLSGGMQRKLSVAAAFIGNSKTVFLDEPTSGVDPYSRRGIWELLIKHKAGRTVILTTHYMDEADILGDRIAIINNGQLKCCGSSLFLKSNFGLGYYLTVETSWQVGTATSRKEDGGKTTNTSPQIEAVTTFVTGYIPKATLMQNLGTELVYNLPYRDNSSVFGKLFSAMDSNKSSMGIISYGISDTKLEEIFLKVAEIHNDDPHDSIEVTVEEGESDELYVGEKRLALNSCALLFLQFWALQIKRFHHNRRSRKSMFCELILPVFLMILVLFVTSILPQARMYPPVIVKPFTKQFFIQSLQPLPYLQAVLGEDGLGTTCVLIDGERSKDCLLHSVSFPNEVASNYTPSCDCSNGVSKCTPEDQASLPPTRRISSGETVTDLTGRQVADYIVKTAIPAYDHKQGYGGYSFGVSNPMRQADMGKKPREFANFYLSPLFPNQAAWDALKSPIPNKLDDNIMVWFNNKGWTSIAAYMNAINNVVLRSKLPDSKKADSNQYGIQLINHPMNFTSLQFSDELKRKSMPNMLNSIGLIFALSFVPASFVVFIVEERATNIKHQQLVSGLSRCIYWLAISTWDLICYSVTAMLCFLVFLAFDEKQYVTGDNRTAFIVLLIIYGWANIPLMYILSNLFTSSSTAFVVLSCGNLLIGFITSITANVLKMFEETKDAALMMDDIFMIFPQFILGNGMTKMTDSYYKSTALKGSGASVEQESIFSLNNVGRNLVILGAMGFLFIIINLIIEFKVFSFITRYSGKLRFKRKVSRESPPDEDDVGIERDRILQGKDKSDILIVKDLTKMYGRKFVAVDNVSFGVKRGECFGLLGLNGAGKTTTFMMLTGHHKPTSGDALINNYSICYNMNEAQQHLGYCPQFDALDPLLTPREHLHLYCALRGLKGASKRNAVKSGLTRLALNNYADRCSGTLSGGNKRKLSTAIALVGQPSIVFLDEPTCGMDPAARRFLWSCILDLVSEGRSVVLTTHSMEECEALCTKLTIMVNGKFKCFGSSQHLKSKYGYGYSLTVNCHNNKMRDLTNFVQRALPSAVFQESHYNQVMFQLKQKTVQLSDVFGQMEKARSQNLIQDFSISQTTLEEVFMKFAKEQAMPSQLTT